MPAILAGDIHFGFDGKLYIAVGDGNYRRRTGARSLRGKILHQCGRHDPTDNPFLATNTRKRRSVYAYGFRNPFRFTRPMNRTYIVAVDNRRERWTTAEGQPRNV
jgi:glucose/arabinose dehydrogenase